jgi:hypothetical protein
MAEAFIQGIGFATGVMAALLFVVAIMVVAIWWVGRKL